MDEDDNGKFNLERVNLLIPAAYQSINNYSLSYSILLIAPMSLHLELYYNILSGDKITSIYVVKKYKHSPSHSKNSLSHNCDISGGTFPLKHVYPLCFPLKRAYM